MVSSDQMEISDTIPLIFPLEHTLHDRLGTGGIAAARAAAVIQAAFPRSVAPHFYCLYLREAKVERGKGGIHGGG